MKNKNIFITRPFLPPFREFTKYLKIAWDNQYLTNNGPLAREFENKLKTYTGAKYAFYVSNGTVALQIAIKAMGLTGEIITTPFTFAATTTAIITENCKPVFADIDRRTLCIDPEKIEKLITDKTSAIMGVHIYGIPCDVTKIKKLAKKYNLKVIYDGAHAFGTYLDNTSLLNFGDISTVSFHATKLFHTGEGGAIFTNDEKIAGNIEKYRNFGYENDEILCAGINGKNSEIHAALGLANFPYLKNNLSKRKKIAQYYIKNLINSDLSFIQPGEDIRYNFAYFPVIFRTEDELLFVHDALKSHKIYARRYFYPSLNTLPFVNYKSCPLSESISSRILCLPLYPSLNLYTIKKIVNVIKQSSYYYKNLKRNTGNALYLLKNN